MNCVLNPTFRTDQRFLYLLQRLDLFKELTTKFLDKIKQEKNPALKILTLITESTPVKGVEPLEHLFLLLKKASFDISGMNMVAVYDNYIELNECDIKNNEEQATTPPGNRLHKFLQIDQLESRLRRLSDDFNKAIREHRNYCRMYRADRKCTRQLIENESQHAPVDEGGDQVPATTDNNDMRSDIQVPDVTEASGGDMYDLVSLTKQSWAIFTLERKFLRDKLLPLEDKLYKMAYDRIYNVLEESVDTLLHACKIAGLKKDLIDEIKGVNCKKLTRQLIYIMSVKYYFPDLQTILHSLDIPKAYKQIPDIKEHRKRCVHRGYKNWNHYGSRDNLLDFDNIADFPRENVYVTATNKVPTKKQGFFSLKKGMKIKQKHVSTDGQTGFGWTCLFKGAPKRYGFYPIDGVKQNT